MRRDIHKGVNLKVSVPDPQVEETIGGQRHCPASERNLHIRQEDSHEEQATRGREDVGRSQAEWCPVVQGSTILDVRNCVIKHYIFSKSRSSLYVTGRIDFLRDQT